MFDFLRWVIERRRFFCKKKEAKGIWLSIWFPSDYVLKRGGRETEKGEYSKKNNPAVEFVKN